MTAICRSDFDKGGLQSWLLTEIRARTANAEKFASSVTISINCMTISVNYIDYKDTAKLRRFLSERSKILPRRTTGTCAMHQRELTEAIKRARQIALLPYVTD